MDQALADNASDVRNDVFAKVVSRYFSLDRTIGPSSCYAEVSTDLQKSKVGVRIIHEESGSRSRFVIEKRALKIRWKPPVSQRVYYACPYNTRFVDDPQWEVEAKTFSKALRRGTVIEHEGHKAKIIDTDRESHHARKHGYNDVYVLEFL